MGNLSKIGIDEELSKQLADKLNKLLANYQLFYMNVRGFHWNIKGDKFFELHLKFEELYNDLILKIDEIAERILTLGYTPIHSYSKYIQFSSIKEQEGLTDAQSTIQNILDSFKEILVLQRDLLDLSEEANDEGTNSLMSDYIREQEKLVWMYSSFLNN